MIAAFVFLFGIHTHKMIEFHKVDEFWAICCVFDPSINSSENSQHQSNGFLYTNIERLASSHSMWLWFNFNKRWIVERTLKPDFTFGCESFHRKYPWIDSKWILNDCKRFWKWLLEMFIGVTSTNWLCFFLLKHWKTPLEVRNIELIIWNSWSHHERWTFFSLDFFFPIDQIEVQKKRYGFWLRMNITHFITVIIPVRRNVIQTTCVIINFIVLIVIGYFINKFAQTNN